MPTKKVKAVILSLFVIHLFLSVYYSVLLPWGGDEWYTYNQSSIMAVPNTILVLCLKSVLGAISVHNYLLYRQIGLFWVMIGLVFLLGRIQSSSQFVSRVAIFHSLYLVFSSYVFFQEQYFRYYGFYLLISFLFFYLLWQFDDQYASKRKYLYALLFVSPFLHLFLGWQLFWYILIKEFTQASRKTKVVFLVFLIVVTIPVAVFWKPLMAFVLPMVDDGLEVTSLELRGLSLGLLVKPIYALFQFMFGYDVEPTENWFVLGLFSIAGVAFIYRLYRLKSENPGLFRLTILAGIVPILSMHWILEPLTLPGATQFESKHALFFLPLFLAVFVPARIDKRFIVTYALPMVVLASVGLGSVASFSVPRADWDKIVILAMDVQAKGGVVVVDGRAQGNFFFYSKGKVDPVKVISVYDVADEEDLIVNAPAVLLVTNDWKSYQILSLKQNWNTGSGTEERFNKVAHLLHIVRETDKVCTGSYGSYPLFAFRYESAIKHDSVSQPKPGFFDLPYQDITLPINKGGVEVYGCQQLAAGDSLDLGNTNSGELSIYHVVSSEDFLPEGTLIGRIESSVGSVALILGAAGADTYSAVYSRPIKEADKWHVWHKRPVFSQSLRYPGSLWPSEGVIYLSRFSIHSGAQIVVTHADVLLNVCAVEMLNN